MWPFAELVMLDKGAGPASQSRRDSLDPLYSQPQVGGISYQKKSSMVFVRQGQSELGFETLFIGLLLTRPGPAALHFDARMQCREGCRSMRSSGPELWGARRPCQMFVFSSAPHPPATAHFVNIRFDQEVWYRCIVSINPLKEAGSLAECSLIESSNMFKRCSQV